MTRLVWSKEKPTVPGWYWWRKKGTTERAICQIEQPVNSKYLWVYCVTGFRMELPSCFGEWAGPLPEPEEA